MPSQLEHLITKLSPAEARHRQCMEALSPDPEFLRIAQLLLDVSVGSAQMASCCVWNAFESHTKFQKQAKHTKT